MPHPDTYSWHQHRSRPQAYRDEARRLYHLTDRELGEALLDLARRAQEENPEPERCRRLIGEILTRNIPEIARRLGAVIPDGLMCRDLMDMSDADLRQKLAGDAVLGVFDSGLPAEDLMEPALSAVAILDIDTLEGNPIATALDRIWMPEDLEADLIAKCNLESSLYYCDQVFSSWSPKVRRLEIHEIDPHAINLHTATIIAEAEGCSIEDAYRRMFDSEI